MIVYRSRIDLQSTFKLRPDEFKHSRARRMRPGDQILICDGQGSSLQANLVQDGQLEVQGPGRAERPPLTRWLLVAVPETKRWDWLLQKATELGVTRITPLKTEFSQALRRRPERDQRIIESAAAQSQRLHLPVLEDELSFQDLCSFFASTESNPLFKHESVQFVLLDPLAKNDLKQLVEVNRPIALVIGPEGGFSPEELQVWQSAGGRAGRLGQHILRVETAALAALAHLLN